MKVTDMTLKQIERWRLKNCPAEDTRNQEKFFCPTDCPLCAGPINCLAFLLRTRNLPAYKKHFKEDTGLEYSDDLTVGKVMKAFYEKKSKTEVSVK